ncbi:MAG TPA: S41 family peptidase [Bryobacteraceae bacterium]|nr:S41 family peptidase [Bryobacteraceae bacterium]
MYRLALFCLILIPAVAGENLDGTWRSEGYGYVFQIDGQKLKAFQVTTRTCVDSFSANRDRTTVDGREASFRTGDGEIWFVRTGGAANRRLLHNQGSVSDIRIDRIDHLPAACDPPTPNTPVDNFDVFAQTWAENYISFDLKHADWTAIVNRNRARVNASTTPSALFDVLESMIEPFGDAHTSISAPALKRRFHGLRPGTDRVVRDLAGGNGIGEFQKNGVPQLLAVTDRAWIHGPLRHYCNDQVQFGYVNPHIGYLRILSFNGYTPQGGFEEGMVALERALDEILSDSGLQALVIDVRINFGGDDPYGIAIASRLATREYLAYTKYARADAVNHDKWTKGDPSTVRPSSRPGFRGPVVELTGPLTISAGETFTQALMGRTPHVTRIGENTQGVFSDVLGRRLPNGWFFGLPNEVYRTPEGVAFDGSGIAPNISVPVFVKADVTAGKDPAMARALEIIGARSQ